MSPGEATALRARPLELPSRSGRPTVLDRPGVQAPQAGEAMQQRRRARAARAENGDAFASCDARGSRRAAPRRAPSIPRRRRRSSSRGSGREGRAARMHGARSCATGSAIGRRARRTKCARARLASVRRRGIIARPAVGRVTSGGCRAGSKELARVDRIPRSNRHADVAPEATRLARSRRVSGDRGRLPGSAGCSTGWTCTCTRSSRRPSWRSCSARRARADPGVKEKSAYIQAAFLLGWALGGSFFGRLGDILGRSRALSLTILTYALFTGLCAFAQTWWQLHDLPVHRRAGHRRRMGGGRVAAVGDVAEGVAPLDRGDAADRGQPRHPPGGAHRRLLSLVLPPHAERYVFLVGVLPAFLVFWIRRHVPEPETWQAASARDAASAAAARATCSAATSRRITAAHDGDVRARPVGVVAVPVLAVAASPPSARRRRHRRRERSRGSSRRRSSS